MINSVVPGTLAKREHLVEMRKAQYGPDECVYQL